ncbi:scarecrow-like protein 22 [Elaeis guineensis]|uniref:Scarecrow-like protein 22 n=1 Tax=Elaeis guineensis var. tenera TaxID=51953 RepID=A0A6I9R2V0_ELAGV|nr:scarecrow-like protein 22 [Elaeis guineensis]XP_010919533.1 scarecrow-like protein 22 [Elaeis guineensis]XP_010919534.1 scarecrow-like protein 22 [Elaeis guineensis]XP_029119961.1 scarecrow-like protein 22 [Elaeis guineensis]
MSLSGDGKRTLEELVGEAKEEEQAIFVGEHKKQRRGGKKEGSEPRSVLETRRSLSPPTSTSTLSPSLCGGGGGGSSDTACLAAAAAVSDGPLAKEGGGAEAQRREEWALELQPITAGLDIGFTSGERGGLGMEDWEAVFSEPAGSPGQDQTSLHWIMGDVDDPTNFPALSVGVMKKSRSNETPENEVSGALSSSGAASGGSRQQALFSPVPTEFDDHSAGLGFGGLVDPGSGVGTIGGMDDAPSVCTSTITLPTTPPFSCSNHSSGAGGLSLSSSNSSTSSSRIPPPPPNTVIQDPTFGCQPSHTLFPPPRPATVIPSAPPQAGMCFQEPIVDRPQLFFSNPLLNEQLQLLAPPNPGFFVPAPSFVSSSATHQPLLPPQLFSSRIPTRPPFPHPSGRPDLFLQTSHLAQQSFPSSQSIAYHQKQRSASGDDAASQQQEQALVEQLFKAAKMVEAGESDGARGILARLNHQLPSPQGKPLIRSTFYFKEALNRILNDAASNSTQSPSPANTHRAFPNPISCAVESVLKLASLKSFSDVSPILMFTNFTCIQALLESLAGADCIHIVDFNVGSGTHWSAFMQELAQRSCTAGGPPMLRISVFVSPEAYHPFDLELACGTLAFWAARLNIPFEFNVMDLDNFDPVAIRGLVDAPIAVNLPVCSAHNLSPTLLRRVKQLTPKVVISVDLGRDRSELSFSHHFLHAFQSCMVLLDSIDAAGTSREVAMKIEQFLLWPRIESSVLGRHRASDKMLPWRTLFASAGFVPLQFSSTTELQAVCLLQRVPVRGFHVEKREGSLFLYWQHQELVSVSAWRC